jgi:hypothetical protein
MPGRQGRSCTVASKCTQAISTGGLEYIDNHGYAVLSPESIKFQPEIAQYPALINGNAREIFESLKK